MALTPHQRKRVAWLIDGHLSDEDEATFDNRWNRHFAEISSPEELYLFASHSDASMSPAEWRLILDNPLCDQGTALLIFWRNSPVYHSEFAHRDDVGNYDREIYDLYHEIVQKYMAGEYRFSLVTFDPTNFRSRSFLDGYERYEIERIPEIMRQSSPGKPVQNLTDEDFEWDNEF